MTVLKTVPVKSVITNQDWTRCEPIDTIQKLLTSANKYGGIQILHKQNNIGAVNLVRAAVDKCSLPESGVWYYPIPEHRRWDVREPRYRTLSEAIVVSIKDHPLRGVFVGTFHPRIEHLNLTGGAQIIEFFDDPEFIREGATMKWWLSYVSKLPWPIPVTFKGSDESFDLDDYRTYRLPPAGNVFRRQ